MMIKEINFSLEVKPAFNSWDFFKEFKELQKKGHFKEVQWISKLDAQKEKKEITKQDADNDFIINSENADNFGIKFNY